MTFPPRCRPRKEAHGRAGTPTGWRLCRSRRRRLHSPSSGWSYRYFSSFRTARKAVRCGARGNNCVRVGAAPVVVLCRTSRDTNSFALQWFWGSIQIEAKAAESMYIFRRPEQLHVMTRSSTTSSLLGNLIGTKASSHCCCSHDFLWSHVPNHTHSFCRKTSNALRRRYYGCVLSLCASFAQTNPVVLKSSVTKISTKRFVAS